MDRTIRVCLIAGALTFSACAAPSEEAAIPTIAQAADGTQIHFEVAGLDNRGPAIVFVHGWSNNRTFASPRFERFAERHPVVAVDVPGFGDSGVDRAEWSIPLLGADIRSVVEALQLERVVLVGHSMGGAVSLAAASLMPERVTGVVTVDWLQDPHQDYDDAFFEEYRQSYESGFRDPDWVRSVAFSPDSPEDNVLRYIDNMPSAVPPHWWLILRSAFQWASDDLVPTLQGLEMPIMAINTDAVPTNLEGYHELVPLFDAHIVEGRGHIGILWEEEAVFDQYLRDFLARVSL